MDMSPRFIILIERAATPAGQRWLKAAAALLLAASLLLVAPALRAQTAGSKVAADLQQVIAASSTPKISWAKDVKAVRYVKALVISNSTDPDLTDLRAAVVAAGGSVYMRYVSVAALSVTLTFAHLGAMMVGGGLAIAADRVVLRAGTPVDGAAHIALADAVGDVHRPVVIALAISAVSGMAQLAADLEALAVNRVMWVKLGLLLALALNGVLMLRNESAMRHESGGARAFARLRLRAITSLVLWLAITLAGVGLMQG